MDVVAASLICIAGLVVAVCWWWAKTRADSGPSDEELDQRDHEARVPRFVITVSGRTTVSFLNRGPQDLDAVTFVFVDGDVEGARVGIDFASAGDLGPLQVGQARTFEAVEREIGRGGEARLRLNCRAGTETWVVGGYFEVTPIAAADTA